MEDKNEPDDQEQTKPKRVIIPLQVLYCQACGNPPEYCQYAKNIQNCLEWRKKNLPDLYEKELQIMMQCLKKQEKENLILQQEQERLKQETANEEKQQLNKEEKAETIKQEEQKEENKEQDKKKENKKKPEKEEKIIQIAVTKRKGKKMLTLIKGLPLFNISLKEISKKFSKKFASGTSIIEDNQLETQGDISDTVVEFLCHEYPQLTPNDFKFIETKK